MAYTINDRRASALGGQSKDRSRSAITTIVWHYSAVARSVRKFITGHEEYWKNTLGWDRGGYHFYIDVDGNIWQNYDYERITWGVYNNNGYCVHISVEAGSGTDYSDVQIAARDWLTRKIMGDLSVPASKVKGHWEVYNNSDCPGYSKSQMDAFRAKLAQPIATVSETVATPATGVIFGGQAHVQQKGWCEMVNNTLGTVGQGLRLEAFSLVVKNNGKIQQLNGSVHIQDIGDVSYNAGTNIFGTAGEEKRLEAVLINVGNGVQYRAHTANIGWGPWVKSGEWAGTKEMGLQIEAIEFRVA